MPLKHLNDSLVKCRERPSSISGNHDILNYDTPSTIANTKYHVHFFLTLRKPQQQQPTRNYDDVRPEYGTSYDIDHGVCCHAPWGTTIIECAASASTYGLSCSHESFCSLACQSLVKNIGLVRSKILRFLTISRRYNGKR